MFPSPFAKIGSAVVNITAVARNFLVVPFTMVFLAFWG
jgi:hypothetical protein